MSPANIRMPQSLHQKYVHIVFSTKNRTAMISGDWEPRLYEYLGGIVRSQKASLVEVNGTSNHVHMLIRESKSVADQDFMRQLKADSSRWVNQAIPVDAKFGWQDGCGWFSVGPADIEAAIAYVRKQKEHHQMESFEDEFRRFLKKYGVDYDERYVWD